MNNLILAIIIVLACLVLTIVLLMNKKKESYKNSLPPLCTIPGGDQFCKHHVPDTNYKGYWKDFSKYFKRKPLNSNAENYVYILLQNILVQEIPNLEVDFGNNCKSIFSNIDLCGQYNQSIHVADSWVHIKPYCLRGLNCFMHFDDPNSYNPGESPLAIYPMPQRKNGEQYSFIVVPLILSGTIPMYVGGVPLCSGQTTSLQLKMYLILLCLMKTIPSGSDQNLSQFSILSMNLKTFGYHITDNCISDALDIASKKSMIGSIIENALKKIQTELNSFVSGNILPPSPIGVLTPQYIDDEETYYLLPLRYGNLLGKHDVENMSIYTVKEKWKNILFANENIILEKIGKLDQVVQYQHGSTTSRDVDYLYAVPFSTSEILKTKQPKDLQLPESFGKSYFFDINTGGYDNLYTERGINILARPVALDNFTNYGCVQDCKNARCDDVSCSTKELCGCSSNEFCYDGACRQDFCSSSPIIPFRIGNNFCKSCNKCFVTDGIYRGTSKIPLSGTITCESCQKDDKTRNYKVSAPISSDTTFILNNNGNLEPEQINMGPTGIYACNTFDDCNFPYIGSKTCDPSNTYKEWPDGGNWKYSCGGI